MLRWYFEPYSQECKQFEYKGLQGNENNFLSKSDCENMCFSKTTVEAYGNDVSRIRPSSQSL